MAASGFALHLEFALPPSPTDVFRALTDRGQLAKWWGPNGFSAPSIELDLRVGGRYRITMQPPEGDVFHLAGEFVAVDPPRSLAYTFRWEEPHPDDRETTATISLRQLDGDTELTVDHGVFATQERLELHKQGWTESIERLRALLSS